MSNINLKPKVVAIVAIVAIVGAILILIFQRGLYSQEKLPTPSQPASQEQSSEPQVLSTNPSPLEEATVFPTQTIEITFDQPLLNEPEFRKKIEPNVELKVELTNGNKTAKITPVNPLQMGGSYTLFILPETKFENGRTLNKEDYIFHFKTIKYSGV